MLAGLVSISFRKHTASEIVEAAAGAGLASIEWGGDVHVPHGDLRTAREVAKQTSDHGLAISAYGSYLRLGTEEAPSIAEVVDTAVELGAPVIRVWAGKKGSADTSPQERQQVVQAALAAADLAAERGILIAYEFHTQTLTDTTASAVKLLEETKHPAIKTFWQPPSGMPEALCLESLEALLPSLSNVHAFHWWPTSSDRLPLSEGADGWKKYLGRIREAGLNPDVSLEFLPGDDLSLLPREAASLLSILDFVAR